MQHNRYLFTYLTYVRYCCYTTLENIGYSSKGLQGKVTCGCRKTDALSLSGCTSLIFVNLGTKIDGCYYCDVVLMQQMLPSIRSTAGDVYVFQQDSAPAYCAHQTVEIRQLETPKFTAPDLWPPNSPDLRLSNMRCYAGLCLSDSSSRWDRSESSA